MPRRAFTASYKLSVCKVAEEEGNRPAGRKFDLSESNVRRWRNKKSVLKEMPKTKKALRGQTPVQHLAKWPELEEELLAWVKDRREKGHAVLTIALLQKAKVLADRKGIAHFKASPSWAYKFMDQHESLGVSLRNMSSDTSTKYNFETLAVSQPREYVKQVEMNRPDKRNAMNQTFYREMRECFGRLAEDGDCRAVVLTGAGKIFTAGLDLTDAADIFSSDMEVGRRATSLKRRVSEMQESYTVMEKCLKPVIAAIHGNCIGGGLDMITACDIRLCTKDASFQIKEVEMGLAADLGTLQRFPKIIGNDSWLREVVYTARKFTSEEAKDRGLVSQIFETREAMIEGALGLAAIIASRSPIAVQTSKASLLYSRDHGVADGLNDMTTRNAAMLQSEDVVKAVSAAMQKTEPTFSKL